MTPFGGGGCFNGFRRVSVLQEPTRLGLFHPGRPMNKVIDIHEARRRLSRILTDVAEGAEVVISRAGMPVARLVPIGTRPRPKQLGLLEGRIELPDDFDAPLAPQVLADFEGRSSP